MTKTPDEIKLGMEILDEVSGLKGYATVRSDMLSGNIQFAIQPKGDGEKVPDAQFTDFHMIKVTGVGFSDELPPIDTTCTIKLGEEVQDTVTKAKGIVTERVTFQNGCVYLRFETDIKQHKDGEPRSHQVTHRRLKRVGPGLTETVLKPKREEGEKEPRTPPGGPSRPMAGRIACRRV